MKLIDLVGTRFTRLVVTERAPSKNGITYWKCRCDCGKEYESTAGHLRSGNIKSCGCLRHSSQYDDIQRDPNIITKSRPIGYDTWVGLKQRCENPKNPGYKSYGAKGIKVCERWRGESGFKNFIEDMGPRPTPKHSIDRREVSGDYCKENCRWATDLQQGENTTRSVKYTHNGKTQHAAAWSRELGLPDNGIYVRIKHGWSIEEALSTPKWQRRTPKTTTLLDIGE